MKSSVLGLDACVEKIVDPEKVRDTQRRLITREETSRLSELFRLLGDPNRARLLYALLEAGELCVCDLAATVEVAESSVSHALRLLRAARVVRARRDGRMMYYRLEDGTCVSGLNRVSRRIAHEGDLNDFAKRAGGPLSHNKFYMGSLIFPLVAIPPALFLNFSLLLLGIWLAVLALMLFRFFVVFKRVACVRCMAKGRCPNARAMGLS